MIPLVKIAREFSITLVGSAAGMGLTVLVLAVMARFLSPGQYGIFTLGISISTIALTLVAAGLPRALDRFIPQYEGLGERGKVRSLLERVLWTVIWCGAAVGVLQFALAGIMARLFRHPALAMELRLLSPTLLLLGVVQVVSLAMAGYKELRYGVYLQQIVLPTAQLILGTAALVAGGGLVGWTLGYVGAVMLTAALALAYLGRQIAPLIEGVTRSPVPMGSIVAYAWPLSVNSIAVIVFSQLDLLFLGYFRPASEVGVYRIYLYPSLALALILASFAAIYKPVLSELIATSQRGQLAMVYQRVTRWAFALTTLGALGIWLFGPTLVRLLFTGSFLVAPAALMILTGGRLIASAFGPQGMTLEAFGHTNLSMLNALVILALNAGLDYALVPAYGMIGAALVQVVGILVLALMGWAEIYVLYRLQPLTGHHVRYLAVAAVSGGLIYGIERWLGTSGVISLLVLAPLLTAAYALGLYLTRSLDAVDYQILGQIRHRVLKTTEG
jgi:stage V sporulation protein B